MSITKERKNFKVSAQRKRGGCWYRPKDVWPRPTLFSVEMSDNHYGNSMNEKLLPLATPLANYYDGEFSQRIERLAEALFRDVYHDPESAFDMVLRNPECAREYGSDLFDIMSLIGGFNIFFANGNVKGEVIETSEEIANNLFLTKRRIGMPVKAFLLYFKGASLRREDISMMSGIPAKNIQWTYNILTTYMWEMLNGIHRRKAQEKASQRKRPARQPVEDIELLVDFSKPRRLSGEMLPTSSEDVDPMEFEVTSDESLDSVEVASDESLDSEGASILTETEPSIEDLNRELARIMAEFGPDKGNDEFDQIPFDPDAGNDI